MLRLKISFTLLTILISLSCLAQDSLQNKKVWTLEECVNLAQKNNITVRRSELTLESTKANYDQSKAAFLPSVSAGATHSFSSGRSIDLATNQFVDAAITQNGELALQANLNIFNGLQNQYRLRQYKHQYQSDLAYLQQTKNDIGLAVADYYLTILLNSELLTAARLQLQSSKEQVSRTEKLVNAGSLPESNLLEVKAQMASEELNVVNAENQLELSKLNLLQGLLLPADLDFEVVVPNVSTFDTTSINASSREIYNIALGSQPGIKSVEYGISSARYSELAARGSRYPSLSVGAGVSTYYSSQLREQFQKSYEEQIRQNRGDNVRINLSIPIFNNFQTRTQIQNAVIFRKRAEVNAIETKNSLRQNVEQAYLNAKASFKRYNATNNQVTSLREAFRINEQRYNVGAINSLDYTLSKNNLNKAEADFIRSKYEYIFRIKILDFYQNKPLTLSN